MPRPPTPGTPPEEYDLEALRAGNSDVQTRLIQREYLYLYRVIFQMVRDPEEARGLVQETFLQALSRIDTFEGRSRLSTWLCGIAVNVTRAFLRKARRYQPCSEEEFDWLRLRVHARGAYLNPHTAWQPDLALERNERTRALHAALERMPEKYSTILTLRDMEGYSTAEAAEALRITESNARVRLHRARNELRRLLSPHLHEASA